METAGESISEEEVEQAYIKSLSRTPSKLARYLELKARKDRFKVNRGPSVARIPAELNEALDHAELLGKKQA